MLQIDPHKLEEIAASNGWLHTRGVKAGTVNAAAMADGVGVHRSTVIRAYDGGAAGVILLEKLSVASGVPIDALLVHRTES